MNHKNVRNCPPFCQHVHYTARKCSIYKRINVFLYNLFNFRYYAIARPLDYHETMTGTELQPYILIKK